MDILVKIIQFFLCFTILIGIHEMGHFIMARVFKIRVEKFYIFFDPWFSLFKFNAETPSTVWDGCRWADMSRSPA